jgi:hypothetical protein
MNIPKQPRNSTKTPFLGVLMPFPSLNTGGKVEAA